jgi:hypothetical protein
LINARFGPSLTDSPIGKLAMLQKFGTMDEYNKKFIALSSHDPSLTEARQVQMFITGFSNPLWTDVSLQQPESLDDTIIFAKAYEQRNASHNGPSSQFNHFTTRFSSKPPIAAMSTLVASEPASSATSLNDNLESSTICLSPTEIA